MIESTNEPGTNEFIVSLPDDDVNGPHPYISLPVQKESRLIKLIKECNERRLFWIATTEAIGWRIAICTPTSIDTFWMDESE